MGITNNRWNVLLLDTKRSNPNHYICLAIEEALRPHPDVESVHKVQLGEAIYRAQEGHCNLFIAFDGEELHSSICRRVKQICGIGVLWVTEDPYELPVNLHNSKIFDLVFTNDSGSVSAYGEKGIHLPLAASPSMHYRPVMEDAQCRYDLFFAGTAWPNRVELFRRLIGSFDGLRVKLALSVNPHLPQIKLEMPRSAYAWRTPNSEFARFANTSRSVLTLHRDYSTSPGAPTAAATPGPRLFEVAMAGGFQLVDAGLPEVGRYFRPDKELVAFEDEHDCAEKLRYYLDRPEERLAIARAAQRRALAEHTYSHRVAIMLTAVVKLPPVSSDTPAMLTSRPRILMVTHNLLGNSPWGGVEVYQDMILRSLRKRFEFWFYAPEPHSGGRICILHDENLEPLERFEFAAPADRALLSCRQREGVFSKILSRYSISMVHFQHLMLHVPSLPAIAHGLGVPTMLSLHDYYALCHHFNLIGVGGHYCGVEDQSESGCDICLKQTIGACAGSQAARRAFYRRIFGVINVIHANTHGVVERYRAVYGNIAQHTDLQVIGVPINAAPTPSHRHVSERLRVAVLGNFTRNKGADIILQAFDALREAPIDFVIYGRVDPQYKQVLTELRYTNLRIHGPFAQGELDNELAEMDVSLHVSIWPETYCLTLSEAWQAGLVPIVSDIGALGERVRDGENGFTFPPGNAGALVDLLRSLAAAPALIEQARSGVRSGDAVTLSEHMEWLERVYQRLSARAIAVYPDEEPEGLSLADCGVFLNNPTWIQLGGDLEPSRIELPAIKYGGSSPLSRLLRYLKNHGMLATARRLKAEIVFRSR